MKLAVVGERGYGNRSGEVDVISVTAGKQVAGDGADQLGAITLLLIGQSRTLERASKKALRDGACRTRCAIAALCLGCGAAGKPVQQRARQGAFAEPEIADAALDIGERQVDDGAEQRMGEAGTEIGAVDERRQAGTDGAVERSVENAAERQLAVAEAAEQASLRRPSVSMPRAERLTASFSPAVAPEKAAPLRISPMS
ncbi:hypothetical protein T190_02400 [Sinorhizobium meliloti CCBAU 01290]|nr:hypothetical protein T190_02400 [Sinorhizobium meliloti CCBAU 01290]